MYSQNDEERVILEYFAGKTDGRFVDVGAWSGATFSNVWALMELGWSGVMVEPSPRAFADLMTNTKPFAERVTLYNVALNAMGGLMPFYDSSGDAVSSLSSVHRDKWEKSVEPMRPIVINALSSALFWNGMEHQAEFINLDVEGLNLELFAMLPWHWDQLKMICVEHDRQDNTMTADAAPLGFKAHYRTKENLILVRS